MEFPSSDFILHVTLEGCAPPIQLEVIFGLRLLGVKDLRVFKGTKIAYLVKIYPSVRPLGANHDRLFVG